MKGPDIHTLFACSLPEALTFYIPCMQLISCIDLQGSNPQEFDIEGVEEGQEGGYIEMVGCNANP